MSKHDDALNEMIEYAENLTPTELAQALAVLKNIQEHIKPLERVLRDTYTSTHTDADHSTVRVNGQPVAELSMTREGIGTYVVRDETAYGAVLHDIEATLPGGYPAVEQKWIPCKEACENTYLTELIRAHGGEIPNGVEYKPGRAATVVVKLASHGGFPLTLEQLQTTHLLQEIEA